MIFLDWYREYLQIKAEHQESTERPCSSCENLKIQLEAANMREQNLIEALTRVNEPAKEPQVIINPQPIRPRHIPFSIKKQHLEAEAAAAAAILKKKLDEMKEGSTGLHVAAPANGSISTEDLEKELDIVADERESKNGERSGTE